MDKNLNFDDKYVKYIEEKGMYECHCCLKYISKTKLNRHIFSAGHLNKENNSNETKRKTKKHFFKKQIDFEITDETFIIRFD